MAKPSQKPRWADTTAVNITEPASGLKDVGYATGDEPAAEEWNWLINRTWQWIEYLDNIHNETINWAVAQVFSAGASFTYPAGASFPVFGTTQITGYNGTADSASGGVGLLAVSGHTTISGETTAPAINAIANPVNAAGVTSTPTVTFSGPKGTVAPNKALKLTGGNSHATGVSGEGALHVIGGSTYTNSGEGTLGTTAPQVAVKIAPGQYNVSSIARNATALDITDASGNGFLPSLGDYAMRIPAGGALKFTNASLTNILSSDDARGTLHAWAFPSTMACIAIHGGGTAPGNGTGTWTPTLSWGTNIASVSRPGNSNIRIDFINAYADENYIIHISAQHPINGTVLKALVQQKYAGYVIANFYDETGTIVGFDTLALAVRPAVYLTCFGPQA